MSGEHAARIEALEAERSRPAPAPRDRTAADVVPLLRDLVAALHSLYTTPPDDKRNR